ncbi:auxin efflux carrier [Xylariaceae sp. FL0662B]|nr:auxin efflux carrier [Xylariaceae sp. FL0662B]
MAASGLGESFLGAIQASLSVLLVISYGGIAARLNLLNSNNTRAISKICVRMFLPALLVTKIGSELHAGSASRYGVVLIWALFCHLVSFLLGLFAHLVLGLPDWTTVALMFNNTTSYPLLLISALDETGILQSLIVTDESTSAAMERAKSYFLVFATVSSCLTFAVGPRLIDTEHGPEDDKDEDPNVTEDDTEYESNEETRLLDSGPRRNQNCIIENSFFPSTRRQLHSLQKQVHRRACIVPKRKWNGLSPRIKWWLLFLSDFFNAPLLGAIIGAVIGLTSPLHRAFFNDTYDGGIFTAWLTASLENIGRLFVTLPVVVAGVSLYTAMKEARQQGHIRSKIPWLPIWFILIVRFILWPMMSILLVFALASRTRALGSDPMLWFAMMLMPCGPPAMKLISLVQISNAEPEDESKISIILTVCYLVSPILSFTVVGSLKASQASI